MALKKKVTISWSGGKDSAFALFKILASGHFDVIHLHTVFNEENHRVGLHGIHERLMDRQAQALGFKLVKLYLPISDDHDAYKKLILNFYQQCALDGIQAVVFGDIFLTDLKKFREDLLVESGMEGIFPLWNIESKKLITEFINTGFKTLICSADEKHFIGEQLGKTIDHHLVKSLPPEVDPNGENGEFHTFVYDGPLFHQGIQLKPGQVVKKRYHYSIQLPDGQQQHRLSTFLFMEFGE